MTRRTRPFIALTLALAAPLALAQQDDAQPAMGSGLTFSGAPTMQEIIAQQKACEARKPPRKAKGTITESAYRKMERVIDQIGKNEYAEAETKLKELVGNARSDYEKAIILQTLAFVYLQTKREMQAIQTFQQAVALEALPQQVHEQMMFNIATIYIGEDKYDEGMAQLNKYLAESCNPVAQAHILLASVYAEKKRWRDALKQTDLALVKNRNPQEQWLQLKMALHYELKELARSAEVLVHLLAMNPSKEDYWKQFSGVLLEIKRDPEATAVLALADRKGYVDQENEYRQLTQIYMFMDIPLKAAQVMQRGLDTKAVEATEKNLEMLAHAWLAARDKDKAEVALKRAAAAASKGDLYLLLGNLYAEKMRWKDALSAYDNALRKGGLKNPGQASLLVAQAAIELKQWKRAEDAIRHAMAQEKSSKEAAGWLSFLQSEQDYFARLEAAREAKENPPEEDEEGVIETEPAPVETQTN